MLDEHLVDLVAAAHHRVERGHRLLEDHRHPRRAQLALPFLGGARGIFAFEQHLAARDRQRTRQQAHDPLRDHRFSRAGLAYETDDLAGLDRERDLRNRLLAVARRGQRDRQLAHFQDAHTRFAIFGSSVSRSPSPRMLTASTVTARKTPGKNTLCGNSMNCTRPSAMMLPQVGMSGGRPTPRNDRIASMRMPLAQMKVPCTISGAIVFGRMWPNMIFSVGVPSAIAASTYGSSRIVRTSERTRRVTRGISGTAIATITVERLAPHSATNANAIRIAGSALTPSITRIRIPSSQRRYPAVRPNVMPKASATSAVRMPTMSDTRVP